MILFRVLNDFDMIIDPTKNGLASKKLIYDVTKRYLYNTNKETIENLNEKDRDKYIKSYMKKYLLDHKHKISEIFQKQHKITENTIHKFVEEKDDFSYFKLVKDLSSLPNHLINGSRTFTNWISTTDNFDGIWNYYDKQNIHKVAVIDVQTNGVYNENTYVVDVSNRKIIDNIKWISNKIDNTTFDSFIELIKNNPEYRDLSVRYFNKFIVKPTDKKFMGFNFSISSKEFSIYEYLSKESILSVLESLQIDLICAELLNDEFLTLKPNQQAYELTKLKNMMLKVVREEKDPYMLYVFKELYLNQHNISNLVSDSMEKERMLLTRKKILVKSQFLPSILIKKK